MFITIGENLATTEEQSAVLINKYNVDPNWAQLVWTTISDYDFEYHTLMDRSIVLPENIEGFAFTASDLITLLPEKIKDCHLYIMKSTDNSKYIVQYAYMQDKGDYMYSKCEHENLIDALYNMVIKVFDEDINYNKYARRTY